MPAVVRIGDSLSTGHGCVGSTTLAGANQGSVFVNSILNIVKFGDEVRELAQPGVIPDKPPKLPSVEDLTKTVGESIETIPRFPTRSISEALEAAGRYADEIGPGAAQEAALAE